MQVKFELENTEFEEEEKRIITEIFDIENTKINRVLSNLAKTAIMEYINMLKKQGLPKKASEIMQDRLFYIISYYYKDKLPMESEISKIFKLVDSGSSTLLKNTISKYRSELKEIITKTLQTVIRSARRNEDTKKYEMEIKSKFILEELKAIITQHGPSLVQIRKRKGLASLYECPEDTYNLLKEKVG